MKQAKDAMRQRIKAAVKQPILRIWRMLNAREREAAETMVAQATMQEDRGSQAA